MNKEEMKRLILEAVSRKLGNGYHGTIQKVLKTNMEQDALVIVKDGENIAPTIYMEPFYEAMENGSSVKDVANSILKAYFHAVSLPMSFDTASFTDLSYIKGRLYVRLINRHLNAELLRDVPHVPFLDDFAVTVHCLVEHSGKVNADFLVHNGFLPIWGIDRETLFSLALGNTRKNSGIELMSINNVIGMQDSPMTADTHQNLLWVLTNREKIFGASAVLFDDVLRDFAEKYGNFYVVFSSVHEVLFFPAPDNSDMDAITKMNQEVNAAQVHENEILGTKAYYYCKNRGFVLSDGRSIGKGIFQSADS